MNTRPSWPNSLVYFIPSDRYANGPKSGHFVFVETLHIAWLGKSGFQLMVFRSRPNGLSDCHSFPVWKTKFYSFHFVIVVLRTIDYSIRICCQYERLSILYLSSSSSSSSSSSFVDFFDWLFGFFSFVSLFWWEKRNLKQKNNTGMWRLPTVKTLAITRSWFGLKRWLSVVQLLATRTIPCRTCLTDSCTSAITVRPAISSVSPSTEQISHLPTVLFFEASYQQLSITTNTTTTSTTEKQKWNQSTEENARSTLDLLRQHQCLILLFYCISLCSVYFTYRISYSVLTQVTT